ncbi:F-box/LRR-repeat protein 20 [Hondaea fermentalgiana]|uniref:F-box/LRR-repeat protein 20 n=1 Tax=Hondaea fermentalgiana TaxID=2315210 RepID=A0A2R5GB07_9STRA|nr:F-box/LRR-repeat protein 20 [Hondaea fermentalgiana]|eukprot:GBG27509.1 F-box/LRR-repeat protein 20 [Hondaea fermentalgiana]
MQPSDDDDPATTGTATTTTRSRLRTNDLANSPAMQRLRKAADPKIGREALHREAEQLRAWEEEQREEAQDNLLLAHGDNVSAHDDLSNNNNSPNAGPRNNKVILPDLSAVFKKAQEAAGLSLSEIPSALFDAEDIELAVWTALVDDPFLRKLARSNESRVQNGVPIGSQLKSAALDPAVGAVTLLSNMYGNRASSTTDADAETANLDGEENDHATHENHGEALPSDAPPAPSASAPPRAIPDRVPFDGIRSLIIPNANKVTDAGLLALARTCQNLRRLNLAQCTQITDVAVRALAKQNEYLEEVDLSQCPHVQGAGLVTIGECCRRLRVLRLRECPASEEWLLKRIATGLPELREIDLSRSLKVTDDTIRTLANRCRKLEKAVLAYCRELSDVAVLALSECCPGLEHLDLRRNALRHKITDVCLLSLAERCPGLSTLLLAGNDFVTDVGVSWLASGCHALEKLTLNGLFKVSDAGIRALGDGCPELVWLDISGLKQVSDVGIRYLADGCKRLKHLECANVYMLTDGVQRDFGIEGLQALVGACADLEYLGLAQCFQVGPRILRLLSEGIDPLTELKSSKLGHALKGLCLRNMPRVSASALEPVLTGRASGTLVKLDLAGCEGMRDRVLRIIGRHCAALESLSLAGCAEISSRGITAMCRVSPRGRPLRDLNLSGCRHVGDLALLALSDAGYDPGLQRLNFRGCEGVSETGLAWLAEKVPTVLELNVFGCNAVSYRGLQALAGHWKYTHVHKGVQFVGVAPDDKCRDMRFIDDYGAVWKAAVLIQSTHRARMARREAARRREIRLMHWTARRLQAHWRGRVARKYAILRRLQRRKEIEAATKLQSLFRARQAQKVAAVRRAEALERRRQAAAIYIQTRWRGKLAKDLLYAARRARQVYIEKCARAATRVQTLWRGRLGRKRFEMLRAVRLAKLAAEEAAATKLQSIMRGRRERRRAAQRKELEALEAERKVQASIKMQQAARVRLARRKLARKREAVEERERAAIKLQCMWRAKKGSLAVHMLRSAKRAAASERAALKVQAIWRGRQGKLAVQMIRQVRAAREAEQQAAAQRMQCMLRKRLARRKVAAVREEKLDRERRQRDLDTWAAILVQKQYRGRIGRKRAIIFREERKRRWKQMHDVEQDRPFYYNQDTGEVRWRMPQDMLDLLPRPACTNCESVDAYVECGTCAEFFCEACWGQVHHGGYRKDHPYRALYDAYGKRIDYGDGEWPSIWPSEIEQDDRLGWHRKLRAEQMEQGLPVTAGIPDLDPEADIVREAEKRRRKESKDEDSRQADSEPESLSDSESEAPMKSEGTAVARWQKLWDYENEREIFLHRQKQKVRFERPADYESPRFEDSWKEYFDEENQVEYWYNLKTGESTYDNPALLVRGDEALPPDSEDGDGEACVDEEKHAEEWVKVFQEETGRAFYHNAATGISVFERPAAYESPREDPEDARYRHNHPTWSRYVDASSGTPYYFNHETHASQYDRPPGYDTPRDDAWMKFHDESVGRDYYYNETSGATQYMRPDGFETPRPLGFEEGADGWTKYVDADSGVMVYENTITGVLQYERPTDFDKVAEGETDGPLRESGPWQEYHDPASGHNYYYNLATGESTYDIPLEFRDDAHDAQKDLDDLDVGDDAANTDALEDDAPFDDVAHAASWVNNSDWSKYGVEKWLTRFLRERKDCNEISTPVLRPEVQAVVTEVCEELGLDYVTRGFGRMRSLVISKVEDSS